MKSHLRPLLWGAGVTLVLVAVLVVALTHISLPQAEKPWSGEGSGQTQIQVVSGDTLLMIGAELEKAGVVQDSSQWARSAQGSAGTAIQPGWYVLREHMGDTEATALMLSPESRARTRAEVRSGLTLDEVEAELAQSLVLSGTWEEAEASVHPRWGESLEGQIGVGSYDFPLNVSTTEVLQTLAERFMEVEIPPIAGLDPYQVITLASIAQGETLPQDWGKVSRVIQNRLAIGMPLQMDSVVAYGRTSPWAGKFDVYSEPGLPPSPITTVSGSAIRTVADAPEGDWLYFVTVTMDGVTEFSASYEEFLVNKEIARANGVLDAFAATE